MEFRNILNFALSSAVICLLVTFVPILNCVFLASSALLVGIKLAQWLMTITRKYILWQTICSKNKAVLITGCDTGFGNALARKLDKLGYTVYATCLDPNGQGPKNLLKECSEKLKVLHMNVRDDRSIQEAKEFVETNLGQNVLWAVVNNAGIAHAGEIDWTSVEEIQRVHDVNTFGPLRVTKCFLPFLKKSKGRIINVTSFGGRYTHPCFVGYCMSKSALIALTTGLRIELAKWNVRVISIEPYLYKTQITDKQAIITDAEKTWKSAPEEIKEEYGEEYVEYIKKTTKILNFLRSTNTNEVVGCLEDAITAKEPMSAYTSGNWIIRLVYGTIPISIMEFIKATVLNMLAKPLALRRTGDIKKKK